MGKKMKKGMICEVKLPRKKTQEIICVLLVDAPCVAFPRSRVNCVQIICSLQNSNGVF